MLELQAEQQPNPFARIGRLGKPTSTVELGVGMKPYEEIVDGIAGGSRAESRRARGYFDDGGADSNSEPVERASYSADDLDLDLYSTDTDLTTPAPALQKEPLKSPLSFAVSPV